MIRRSNDPDPTSSSLLRAVQSPAVDGRAVHRRLGDLLAAQADDHRQRRQRARRRAERAHMLIRYGLMLVGAAAFEGLFLYLQRWIIIGASRRIEYDMRNDFYAHLQKLPLTYYQDQRTGDLMSRATNDLSSVRMLIGPAVDALAVVAARRHRRVHHDDPHRSHDGADRAGRGADRRRPREVLRTADPSAIQGRSGLLRRHLRARAGEPGRRARRARVRAGAERDRHVQADEPRVRRAEPIAHQV